MRHASTILSSAALLTEYVAMPGHGWVIEACTDDRYAAAPFDSRRWGSPRR